MFCALKGTSPQLLKSNLGSELSGEKSLAFDVDKRWNESEFRIESIDLDVRLQVL